MQQPLALLLPLPRNLSQVPEHLMDADTSGAPVFIHRIPAGFPSPADDYIEANLDLNEYLIRHKAATFIFRVQGESMSGAGIMDGDCAVVDRTIEPGHDHIVVAVVESEFTIKRLYRRGGRIELRAENPRFPAMRFEEGAELQVWGVVVGVVRRLLV